MIKKLKIFAIFSVPSKNRMLNLLLLNIHSFFWYHKDIIKLFLDMYILSLIFVNRIFFLYFLNWFWGWIASILIFYFYSYSLAYGVLLLTLIFSVDLDFWFFSWNSPQIIITNIILLFYVLMYLLKHQNKYNFSKILRIFMPCLTSQG